MVNCEICDKYFQYPSQLIRHYNAIRKCVPKPEEEQLQNEEHQNRILENIQSKIKNECIKKEIKCIYCAKIFKNNGDKNRHEKTCKLNTIPAVKMEIKLGIPIGEYQHTMCKFCKHDAKYRSNYMKHIKSCKARYKYEKELYTLLEQKTNKTNKVINNTINNNTYNTVNNTYNINKIFVVLKNFNETNRIMLNEMDKVLGWVHEDYQSNPSNTLKWNTPINMIIETHGQGENRNIKTKSATSEKISIYENGQWKEENYKEIFKTLIMQVKTDLEKINKSKQDVLYRTAYMMKDLIKQCVNSDEYIAKNKTKFLSKLRELTNKIEEDIVIID